MPRYILLTILFIGLRSWAQDTDILLNHDLYHYVDRLDVLGLTNQTLHTDVKPYGRQYLAEIMDSAKLQIQGPQFEKWHKLNNLLVDDSLAAGKTDRPILKYFYRNRRDLLHIEADGLQLFINPVLHTSAGLDRNDMLDNSLENLPIYTNSRGVQVRGSLLGKIGFYTEAYDNYNRFHQFIYNRYVQSKRLYGEGFVKTFDSLNGLDYFSFRAYLTYSPFKNMRIKFGKDRAFWGNGYQSLLLSDYAADPLMLNITTRIWKLEYVNHFTQMIDFLIDRNDDEGVLPRKYGAFHLLNFKPNRHFSIGVFESVIYTPYLANGNRGFELQYLNPIIFYRAIEQYIGSPDNALLGAMAKWNFLKRFQLYGQILLDDYNYGVRNVGTGYWGNKMGWQAGLKYMNVAEIQGLDLQFEYNQIRPYTYQHFNVASNYSSYGQSLGHAAGANLRDLHFILRYHPLARLNLYLSYSYLFQGEDETYLGEINYGGNIEQPTGNRPVNNPDLPDFDHRIGQGVLVQTHNLYGRLSWQILQSDAYLEAEGRFRKENENTSLSLLLGLRANIVPRPVKF
jgi:hypothetical protein